jgi:hypothetical protein
MLKIRGDVMTNQTFRITGLFSEDAVALVNGFARAVSHLVTEPVEGIANACDVSGILVFRRAGRGLYRAAGREGQRTRRHGGLFGCLRYLSDLT